MLQSYKKIKYQHTKNQKKQEMEMPDNKQVSNLLKKKNNLRQTENRSPEINFPFGAD